MIRFRHLNEHEDRMKQEANDFYKTGLKGFFFFLGV